MAKRKSTETEIGEQPKGFKRSLKDCRRSPRDCGESKKLSNEVDIDVKRKSTKDCSETTPDTDEIVLEGDDIIQSLCEGGSNDSYGDRGLIFYNSKLKVIMREHLSSYCFF
jgi:hypothetical protein